MPFPKDTARTWLRYGMSTGVGGGGTAPGAGREAAWRGAAVPPAGAAPASVRVTRTPVTPSTPCTALRASRARVGGSCWVRMKVNDTCPAPSTVSSLTMPAERTSVPWRGCLSWARARSMRACNVSDPGTRGKLRRSRGAGQRWRDRTQDRQSAIEPHARAEVDPPIPVVEGEERVVRRVHHHVQVGPQPQPQLVSHVIAHAQEHREALVGCAVRGPVPVRHAAHGGQHALHLLQRELGDPLRPERAAQSLTAGPACGRAIVAPLHDSCVAFRACPGPTHCKRALSAPSPSSSTLATVRTSSRPAW